MTEDADGNGDWNASGGREELSLEELLGDEEVQPGMARSWCCYTDIRGPHQRGCAYSPIESIPAGTIKAEMVTGAVWDGSRYLRRAPGVHRATCTSATCRGGCMVGLSGATQDDYALAPPGYPAPEIDEDASGPEAMLAWFSGLAARWRVEETRMKKHCDDLVAAQPPRREQGVKNGSSWKSSWQRYVDYGRRASELEMMVRMARDQWENNNG